MTSGIYCIENNITGNKYIGQGKDAKKRMFLFHGNCRALLDAFEKYGEENFSRYILEYCDVDILDEREEFYIKELKTHVSEGGYNISYGGSVPMRGIKFSDDHKLKISQSNKGRVFSEEHKEKLRLSHIGMMVSDNARKKIGDSETGEKHHFWGKKRPDSTSSYFGVSWHDFSSSWQIRITVSKKVIRIGQSKIEVEAAKMYDNYVIQNNLPNPLNFPEDYE